MAVNTDTLYDFEKIISTEVTRYITDYSDFIDNHLPYFVSFYKGEIDNVPLQSLSFFNNLIQTGQEINNIVTQHLNLLTRNDFVDTIELLDNIFYSLGTVSKLSRFLKSSRINTSDTGRVSYNTNVSAHQTPELIHKDRNDPQNEWVDTYVKNRIYELDYESEGGYSLTKETSSFQSFDINTVIDNLVGEKMNGKDIDRNFKFTYDLSDIEVLDYNATAKQTFETALSLNRGDNPFYKDTGIDPLLAFGDLKGANVQFIIQDISGTVNSDDCFQDFKVDDITSQDNLLVLSCSASTLFNNLLKNTATI